MLEAGLWLQKSGCRGVGVSTSRLEASWKMLQRSVEQERTNIERKRKLKRRYKNRMK